MKLSREAFVHWIGSCGIRSLDDLRVGTLKWLELPVEERTRGGLPIDVRNLTFFSCCIHFSDILLCLPTNSSTLTSFTVESHRGPIFSPAEFEILAAAIGPQLEHFAFGELKSYEAAHSCPPPLNSYGEGEEGPSIPLALFTSFPSLRLLSLLNTRDLSLEKLEALARTSPRLVTLRFPGTIWDEASIEDFNDAEPWRDADARIAAVISSLDALEELNLGWVPLDWYSQKEMRRSKEAAELRRVELEYELCGEEIREETEEEQEQLRSLFRTYMGQ